MESKICVFGEVLFDVFSDGHEVLGGAPFNVAWHLQAFAQRPLFVSRVGDDQQGRDIASAMRQWGMTVAGLQVDSSLPTGRVSIEFIDGEPSYDIVSPGAYDAIDNSVVGLDAHGLLYHGSLALRHEAARESLDNLIDAGVERIFLDVNLRDPWWDRADLLHWMTRAHWVKLNHDEFDLLYPGHGSMNNALESFIDDFSLQGAILTHGSSGAELQHREQGHFSVVPRDNVEVVDTVGAGDAFTSVVIMAIGNEWSMQLALDRAQDFASRIVGQRGATVSDPGFYRDIQADWR